MKYKKECLQLAALCESANIPYEICKCWDGWQLCYPCADLNIRVSDAICHSSSYGHEKGLLEIMGACQRGRGRRLCRGLAHCRTSL